MNWEFDVLHWFQTLHGPVMDKVALAFTLFCEKGIGWIILIMLVFLFAKDKRVGLTGMLAFCLSFLLCNLLLKNMISRDRPCWIDTTVDLLVEIPDDYSFPSGHTSFSFASAMAIFQYWKGRGVLAFIVAALIGLSRLYLFVHFPTDVLVGAVIGIVSGALAGLIVRDFYKKYPNFRIPVLERSK